MQLFLKKRTSMNSLKEFGFQEYYKYFEKMIPAGDFDVTKIKHKDALSHFWCLFDSTKSFYIIVQENREIRLLMLHDEIISILPKMKKIEITQLLSPILQMVKKDLIEIDSKNSKDKDKEVRKNEIKK